MTKPNPLLSKEGIAAQRPGWLVKGRVASLYARAALLIFFQITNHLEKMGNGLAAIICES